MRPTTTTALALAGTALALPAVAAAESLDPPTPTETTLAAPFVGHVTVGDQMDAARRTTLEQHLVPRATRLAGKVARVKGVSFSERRHRRELRGSSPGELRADIRRSRRQLTRAREDSTAAPHLEAIAACESGGNPRAVDASGTYRGKFQFDYGTWASVGGSGDPAAASEAEQNKRAAILYAQSGATPWPVCGQ